MSRRKEQEDRSRREFNKGFSHADWVGGFVIFGGYFEWARPI